MELYRTLKWGLRFARLTIKLDILKSPRAVCGSGSLGCSSDRYEAIPGGKLIVSVIPISVSDIAKERAI
jgi:hypothetical protein